MERVLHITLTFTPGTTDKEACAEFSAIHRQFLRLFPGGYMRILAFTQAGAPHLHVVAVTDKDIQAGFDFEAYKEMRTLNDQRELTPEQKAHRNDLGRRLTTNEDLKSSWSLLKDLLKRRREEKNGQFTFAPRFEACPIIKNVEALAEYLGKNTDETMDKPSVEKERGKTRWAWEHGKLSRGVRPVSFGGDFPQAAVYSRSKGQIWWESMTDVIIAALGMQRAYMSHRFHHPVIEYRDGDKVKRRRQAGWNYYIRERAFPIILGLYGQDFTKWPIKEVGEIAYGELAHMDQWKTSGWPKKALDRLNAPSWQEQGFASFDDYTMSMFSMEAPTVSMPLPEIKQRKGRGKLTPVS